MKCPRKLFLEHLRDKLIEWRQNGDRILLLIDTNEDMSDGHLQRIFSRTLGMSDVVREVGGVAPTATYHRGTRQIDGAWATEDLQVTRACFLPFLFGVGDHRGILLDIPVNDIIGGMAELS